MTGLVLVAEEIAAELAGRLEAAAADEAGRVVVAAAEEAGRLEVGGADEAGRVVVLTGRVELLALLVVTTAALFAAKVDVGFPKYPSYVRHAPYGDQP